MERDNQKHSNGTQALNVFPPVDSGSTLSTRGRGITELTHRTLDTPDSTGLGAVHFRLRTKDFQKIVHCISDLTFVTRAALVGL